MAVPILKTKLFFPAPDPRLVDRPRLMDRLDQSLSTKLIIVSAPAGYGKTTAVAQWLSKKGKGEGIKAKSEPISPLSFPISPFKVSWLSLDDGENDPLRFMAYLIYALQAFEPNWGDDVLGRLQSPAITASGIESHMLAILNQLASSSTRRILVLDDYHLIQSEEIHQAMAYFLEHLPPQFHVVMITREQPPLPLSRWRARGQLAELGLSDLRFDNTDAKTYFNQRMALSMVDEEVELLTLRTEGWIAGLQLAAMSYQDGLNRERLIAGFTGSHRYIFDYLIEEVLQNQPESIRQFLLETSILPQLNESLCAAVVSRPAADQTLAQLARENLFVLPLDDQRAWYRYHHLFAESLQAQLDLTWPNRSKVLHQRASQWYESNGYLVEAIEHALLAADFERATGLIERDWSTIRHSYNDFTLINWLANVPTSIFSERPSLSVDYAFALHSIRDFDQARDRLADAEQWLLKKDPPSSDLTDLQMDALPGMIAVARAYLAGAGGDISNIIEYANEALEILPEQAYLGKGAAGALLGLTHWNQGELAEAYRSIDRIIPYMEKTGNVSAVISTLFLMADISLAQGRLQRAYDVCQRALKLGRYEGRPDDQGTADILVVLSEIALERGDLEEARARLQAGDALGEHAMLEVMRFRRFMAEALIDVAEQAFEKAHSALDEAKRTEIESPAPNWRPIESLRAQIWLKEGRLPHALAWAETQDLSPTQPIYYLNLFDVMTLAHILLAQYESEPSPSRHKTLTQLLERLRAFAASKNLIRDQIDVELMQAYLHRLSSSPDAASASHKLAQDLAQSEGFILSIDPAFSPFPFPLFPLLDPLTPREIEVLEHMALGLTNQEIGNQLHLTLNTIKVHSRNIYSKLDVRNRTEAIARARELDLIR